MTTATTPESTMARLKAETADLHRDAETSRFQRALVKGELGRDAYAAWLGQMLIIHSALEGRLRACPDPRAGALNLPEYDRAADLQADLAILGVEPAAIAPLPAAAAFAASLDGADALALLGMRYVLEGSNNGNRFIARAIRQALPGAPTGYLDPYAERQPAMWSAFKVRWDEEGFGRAEQDRLVSAARAMFATVGDLSKQLASATLPEGA